MNSPYLYRIFLARAELHQAIISVMISVNYMGKSFTYVQGYIHHQQYVLYIHTHTHTHKQWVLDTLFTQTLCMHVQV
jgi:hypothetical protein